MKKLKIWTKYKISVKSEKYKGIIMPFQRQVLGMLTAFREIQLEKNPPFDYLKKWFLQLATLENVESYFKIPMPKPYSRPIKSEPLQKRTRHQYFLKCSMVILIGRTENHWTRGSNLWQTSTRGCPQAMKFLTPFQRKIFSAKMHSTFAEIHTY